MFLHGDSEDSDQTGRMPKLIGVFAGRTCHIVCRFCRDAAHITNCLHTINNYLHNNI